MDRVPAIHREVTARQIMNAHRRFAPMVFVSRLAAFLPARSAQSARNAHPALVLAERAEDQHRPAARACQTISVSR